MAQEGIATLPMQGMAPQESQGIGAFEPQSQDIPEIGEKERFDAVMVALQQQAPEMANKVEQILDEAALTPEQVDALEQVVNFLEQNKDNYSAALQSLIQQGAVEEGDFPAQYNQEFMTLMKIVVYGYQARAATPEPVPFNKGGLAQAAESLRRQGRGGDTILAHINPEEARLLKRMGGSGTINPNTGLPEFLKFKGITKVVTAPLKAVGGVVKSVVGAANKILGPELTGMIVTVGGFMIGGPAGAALAQGLYTYGSGGSFKDILLNSATAYIGGAYGPTAGALAGGASTLIRGGSLKDAIKAAAISGAVSYGMNQMGQLGSQGMAPEGANLSQTGSIDASGNFVPDASVATPGSVTATNPSGTGTPVVTPNTVSPFGLNAGPAPTSAPGSLNIGSASNLPSLDFQAPSYALNAPVSAPSAGISSLPNAAAPSTSPGFLSNLGSGNIMAAGKDAFGLMAEYPKTSMALGLAATGALGGFKSEPATPPGIVKPNITGETLVGQDPNKYIVQGMPGVRYDASGNIDRTGTGTVYQPNPAFESSQTFASPQYGTQNQPVYPVYTPPMNAAAPVPGNQVIQPYNTMAMYNFMPSNQPRYYANGGIAAMFPPGESVMQMNRGGYPRKTGQISGPGTGTSDDIPAMLSDGEFVVTAKAVRGIGNGSRREGAKKLYRMMHAMEKKAGGKV
jgi:hypothetical protein